MLVSPRPPSGGGGRGRGHGHAPGQVDGAGWRGQVVSSAHAHGLLQRCEGDTGVGGVGLAVIPTVILSVQDLDSNKRKKNRSLRIERYVEDYG